MSLTERVRNSIPPQTGLRQVSLRTKLVAAVLVLVVAALMLISSASTYALHNYLLQRLDDSLTIYAQTIAGTKYAPNFPLPSDYYLSLTTVEGGGFGPLTGDRTLAKDDMPPKVTGIDNVLAAADTPYTVKSQNGKIYWRVIIYVSPTNGTIIQVGEKLSVIEKAVTWIVWVDVLVGVGVLIALASVGAAIVRQSLIPLVQIERTAAAIAAGDLTQRVPDPEAHDGEPATELGRLARALNAMLAQIEAAFTARAQSESAARDAAEAAQTSEARAVRSEAKMRQFVADASHELRTPLTTIRGFAELYRQGAVRGDEDVARLVRRIEDEAARMGLLVEDLLLLARLDRERPLEIGPVELPVLALDAVSAARATAPTRKIELVVRDEPEMLVALADETRLRQVIGNLMTNALVHTPPEADVEVRLYAVPGNRAVIEIADDGPGLSEEQKAHVFERFYRADEARTRRVDRSETGTGLGLAIVAAIVHAHQGTVEVDSEPGKGATFRVTLPAVAPS